MKFNKIVVPMTDDERAALVLAARHSMREPQQHARFILRCALLGAAPMSEPDATEPSPAGRPEPVFSP